MAAGAGEAASVAAQALDLTHHVAITEFLLDEDLQHYALVCLRWSAAVRHETLWRERARLACPGTLDAAEREFSARSLQLANFRARRAWLAAAASGLPMPDEDAPISSLPQQGTAFRGSLHSTAAVQCLVTDQLAFGAYMGGKPLALLDPTTAVAPPTVLGMFKANRFAVPFMKLKGSKHEVKKLPGPQLQAIRADVAVSAGVLSVNAESGQMQPSATGQDWARTVKEAGADFSTLEKVQERVWHHSASCLLRSGTQVGTGGMLHAAQIWWGAEGDSHTTYLVLPQRATAGHVLCDRAQAKPSSSTEPICMHLAPLSASKGNPSPWADAAATGVGTGDLAHPVLRGASSGTRVVLAAVGLSNGLIVVFNALDGNVLRYLARPATWTSSAGPGEVNPAMALGQAWTRQQRTLRRDKSLVITSLSLSLGGETQTGLEQAPAPADTARLHTRTAFHSHTVLYDPLHQTDPVPRVELPEELAAGLGPFEHATLPEETLHSPPLVAGLLGVNGCPARCTVMRKVSKVDAEAGRVPPQCIDSLYFPGPLESVLPSGDAACEAVWAGEAGANQGDGAATPGLHTYTALPAQPGITDPDLLRLLDRVTVTAGTYSGEVLVWRGVGGCCSMPQIAQPGEAAAAAGTAAEAPAEWLTAQQLPLPRGGSCVAQASLSAPSDSAKALAVMAATGLLPLPPTAVWDVATRGAMPGEAGQGWSAVPGFALGGDTAQILPGTCGDARSGALVAFTHAGEIITGNTAGTFRAALFPTVAPGSEQAAPRYYSSACRIGAADFDASTGLAAVSISCNQACKVYVVDVLHSTALWGLGQLHLTVAHHWRRLQAGRRAEGPLRDLPAGHLSVSRTNNFMGNLHLCGNYLLGVRGPSGACVWHAGAPNSTWEVGPHDAQGAAEADSCCIQ